MLDPRRAAQCQNPSCVALPPMPHVRTCTRRLVGASTARMPARQAFLAPKTLSPLSRAHLSKGIRAPAFRYWAATSRCATQYLAPPEIAGLLTVLWLPWKMLVDSSVAIACRLGGVGWVLCAASRPPTSSAVVAIASAHLCTARFPASPVSLLFTPRRRSVASSSPLVCGARCTAASRPRLRPWHVGVKTLFGGWAACNVCIGCVKCVVRGHSGDESGLH